MPRRLTDIEIAARIVPTMVRWPAPEVAKTVAWDRLRDGVAALRGLVGVVDSSCLQAEQDQDLSPDGIARRRAALGRQALNELEQFKPFQIAERAVTENIQFLEQRMIDLPKPPTNIADVALAQEIRAYVRSQKSPIDVAAKSISDPRILGAILNAPPFLSGLTDAEFNLVKERARTALHPEQAQMQQWLTKALQELREGIAATKRTLLERCQINAEEDGQSRSTRQPLSGGASAATKTATAA
jgi:hypothetical protein